MRSPWSGLASMARKSKWQRNDKPTSMFLEGFKSPEIRSKEAEAKCYGEKALKHGTQIFGWYAVNENCKCKDMACY